MIDQLQAVAIATRFLVAEAPELEFCEVWANLSEDKWWISFGLISPPGVVQSPGGVCVTVDVKTGQPEWFETL